MKTKISLLFIALALASCTNNTPKVRVENTKPEAPKPLPAPKARTEPIFYNGKTYTLKFSPVDKGRYDISVLGMSAKQQKDAVAVGTSSIRYFACPDEQTGKLTEQAKYVGGIWQMQARCG
jgi:hypothetical protein